MPCAQLASEAPAAFALRREVTASAGGWPWWGSRGNFLYETGNVFCSEALGTWVCEDYLSGQGSALHERS